MRTARYHEVLFFGSCGEYSLGVPIPTLKSDKDTVLQASVELPGANCKEDWTSDWEATNMEKSYGDKVEGIRNQLKAFCETQVHSNVPFSQFVSVFERDFPNCPIVVSR